MAIGFKKEKELLNDGEVKHIHNFWEDYLTEEEVTDMIDMFERRTFKQENLGSIAKDYGLTPGDVLVNIVAIKYVICDYNRKR